MSEVVDFRAGFQGNMLSITVHGTNFLRPNGSDTRESAKRALLDLDKEKNKGQRAVMAFVFAENTDRQFVFNPVAKNVLIHAGFPFEREENLSWTDEEGVERTYTRYAMVRNQNGTEEAGGYIYLTTNFYLPLMGFVRFGK